MWGKRGSMSTRLDDNYITEIMGVRTEDTPVLSECAKAQQDGQIGQIGLSRPGPQSAGGYGNFPLTQRA